MVCDGSGTGYDGVLCDQPSRTCDDDDAGTCGAHAVSIDTRCGTTCVLLDGNSVRCWRVGSAGTVDCWGCREGGALGRATPDGMIVYPTPTAASGLSDVHALGSGFQHTCALMNDASLRCWGKNNPSQSGDGMQIDRFTPEPGGAVLGIASNDHTAPPRPCAVSELAARR